MSDVRSALLRVASELRLNALGMKAEMKAEKGGMGKLVLAAEMGAIIRVMRCIERAASVDTHPKDGDVEQAPLVSGAVAKPDAHGESA